MLVLSRKKETSIHIGDDIIVKVVEIRPGKVRLGVVAPAGVRVMRNELVMGAAAGESAGAEPECSAPPKATNGRQ